MSLLERVQRAGNDKALSGGVRDGDDLDMLRDQVRRIVSVEEIAAIASSNPQRAKNELRSACRQVFEDPVWVGIPSVSRNDLVERLVDEVFGFGPLEGMLNDERITEIMVNGPGSVFYESEGVLHRSSQAFSDAAQLRALIDRILGPLGRRIDEASPMVDARLPEGHRVHAVIPPLALDGPLLTIRKFTEKVITLEEMESMGSIPASVRSFLSWTVRTRRSIAVSGGTGSGKTTLLNALSCEISQSERIITIEDSAELRFLEHPHVVRLEARPRNAEGVGEVTIRDLVANALRMRPDRIIVGECRGAEALDMLQAMKKRHIKYGWEMEMELRKIRRFEQGKQGGIEKCGSLQLGSICTNSADFSRWNPVETNPAASRESNKDIAPPYSAGRIELVCAHAKAGGSRRWIRPHAAMGSVGHRGRAGSAETAVLRSSPSRKGTAMSGLVPQLLLPP